MQSFLVTCPSRVARPSGRLFAMSQCLRLGLFFHLIFFSRRCRRTDCAARPTFPISSINLFHPCSTPVDSVRHCFNPSVLSLPSSNSSFSSTPPLYGSRLVVCGWQRARITRFRENYTFVLGVFPSTHSRRVESILR